MQSGGGYEFPALTLSKFDFEAGVMTRPDFWMSLTSVVGLGGGIDIDPRYSVLPACSAILSCSAGEFVRASW